MDLNFLFNQHLKTLGLFLNKKLPDEDFKTMKFLVRQLQDSIAERLVQADPKQFILSTLSSGGKNDNTK